MWGNELDSLVPQNSSAIYSSLANLSDKRVILWIIFASSLEIRTTQVAALSSGRWVTLQLEPLFNNWSVFSTLPINCFHALCRVHSSNLFGYYKISIFNPVWFWVANWGQLFMSRRTNLLVSLDFFARIASVLMRLLEKRQNNKRVLYL